MVGATTNRARVRFGIVGLGQAGSALIGPISRHPRATLSAAADLRPEVLDAFGKDVQAELFTSIEALCASPNVDVVYIATPTQFHTEHVLMALGHRKHVVVEKPMALTLADSDRMIDAAERNGVVFVVGHSQSFEPPNRKMREIVKSGQLGRLRMMHNWYFNDWLYRPRTDEELHTALGGGVTFRQGAHQVDILRLIGGGLVRSVRAVTAIWDSDRPTEGSHVIFLDFENGAAATAIYNGYDHFHSVDLTFGIGEGGQRTEQRRYAEARQTLKNAGGREGEATLKKRRGYGQSGRGRADARPPHQSFYGLTLVSCEHGDIRQSPSGLSVYDDEKQWEVPLPPGETGRDLLVNEVCEAVVNNRPPLHDGRWAKANLEICLAALESSRGRREILLSYQVPVRD